MKKAVKKLFAERELYIRSDGRVRYITLTPRKQIVGVVVFACLVASMLVTGGAIIFENQITAFKQMSNKREIASYQRRIVELETAYHALNNKHQITQDWFKEVTNALETRHNELTEVFEQNASISDQLNDMQKIYATAASRVKRSKGKTIIVAQAGEMSGVHFDSRLTTGVDNGTQFTLSGVDLLADKNKAKLETVTSLTDNVQDRIDRLSIRQQELLDALEESTDQKIVETTAIIEQTRVIETDAFIAKLENDKTAMGGPYIPLSLIRDDMPKGIKKQITRIGNNLQELNQLNKAIANIPLARPVHYYKTTSHFGPRMDPFNKRPAFHSGLDFGAPSGTRIHATLAGKIVKAGRKGPYGNVVEIDHGNGFHTRYGHMKSIKVKLGQEVDFHEVIGTVGSSGRSTGPHLHYEIWYEGKVKDPISFIRAGQHVFSAQLQR